MSNDMSDPNLENPMDHMWSMHMRTLMKRKKNMEVAQIIDEVLFQYYSDKGTSVPKWKHKDPDWWRDYLISLGIDPRNP